MVLFWACYSLLLHKNYIHPTPAVGGRTDTPRGGTIYRASRKIVFVYKVLGARRVGRLKSAQERQAVKALPSAGLSVPCAGLELHCKCLNYKRLLSIHPGIYLTLYPRSEHVPTHSHHPEQGHAVAW